MDSYVVSKRLGVHPSDVHNAVEGWHERLPEITFGRRTMRVGSRFWLAAKPHEASADPLELYRVRGLLWLFGRPIRVMLEFSIWSDTVSQVAVRPEKLTWPVCTERYGRRAARILEDVVTSVASQGAPLVARPRDATPRLVSGFRPLRGFSARSAVRQRFPLRWPRTLTQALPSPQTSDSRSPSRTSSVGASNVSYKPQP